jgi:hypothetical protein
MLAAEMIPGRKRPVGITLLALAYLWIGLGTIIFPILLYTGAVTDLWRHIAPDAIHSEVLLKFASYLFFFVLYACYVAYALIGFGLWKLRNWARKSAIAFNVFLVISTLPILLFRVRPWFIGIPLLLGTLPVFGWIIWYLRRPRVRFAFGESSSLDDGEFSSTPRGLSKMGIAWVVVGVVATFALFFVCVMCLAETMMHAVGAYPMALKQAQNSPCVAELVGTPITPEWMISGNTNENSTGGSAELSIPVHGPKGSGSLELEARKRGGAWHITSLVLVHDSDNIQIVPSQSSCP